MYRQTDRQMQFTHIMILWGRPDNSSVNVFQPLTFVVKNAVRHVSKLLILEFMCSYKFYSDDYFLVHTTDYAFLLSFA